MVNHAAPSILTVGVVVMFAFASFWMIGHHPITPLGEEWLSPRQEAYAHYALSKYCPRQWIIYTPYYHPMFNGYSTSTTITIYNVKQRSPYELYCLIRHECEETLQGERHNWDRVLEECR